MKTADDKCKERKWLYRGFQRLVVESQHPVKVMFRGPSVGDFCADLFVEGSVIVELKAVKAIDPTHQAQIINYLNATGIGVGLLINFGNPKLEFKRFTRKAKLNMDLQDAEDEMH